MIVIGIDPHTKTHTAVAVDSVTGWRLGTRTVASDGAGHDELLAWARSLGPDRYFAIEDCRHVSGRLERHLLPHGERVVRVPPKMMAGARWSARAYGKSDPIDAACVARAALREPGLREASLRGPEQDARLLVDHRDDLVDERKCVQERLRWHCHDLEVDLDLPSRALDRYVWLDRLEAALDAMEQTTRRRIAMAELSRIRELTTEVRALEREIRGLMRELAPGLMGIPGCSAISAAHLVGQTGAPPASAARRPSRCTSEWHRSRSPRASHAGTDSIAAGTASSTR